MQRIIVIFLVLLYTASTSGIMGINSYCHGKLKATKVFPVEKPKDCCAEEGDALCMTEMDDGCCDSKAFFVKVSDQHSPASRLLVHGDDLINYTPALLAVALTAPVSQNVIYISSKAPPLSHKEPVYLNNCNFRI